MEEEREEAGQRVRDVVKSIKAKEVKNRIATVLGAISLLSYFFFMAIFFMYFAVGDTATYCLAGALGLGSLLLSILFMVSIEYAEIQELDDLLPDPEESDLD